MRVRGSIICLFFVLHLASIDTAGVGKAWRVNVKTDYPVEHPLWSRLDSSPLEVRSVSGFGRLLPSITARNAQNIKATEKQDAEKESGFLIETVGHSRHDKEALQIRSNKLEYSEDQRYKDVPLTGEKVFKTKLTTKILPINYAGRLMKKDIEKNESKNSAVRIRREAENESNMGKVGATISIREARLISPEQWPKRPMPLEFRHRAGLDHMIPEEEEDDDVPFNTRRYKAPRADFVTSHYRRGYLENRDSREMPVSKSYNELDMPWYRNMIRDRDYDLPPYRRGYDYYRYPDRYRMERDYYTRLPTDPAYSSFYYDRYRDEDFDLYGRSRPTPKPKRVIYYATLPEVVRKPVDLRNYPRTYDGLSRSSGARTSGTYERVPGNIDPNRFRYKQLYEGYDSFAKRSSFLEKPYATNYRENEDHRQDGLKEGFGDNEGFSSTSSERNSMNQIQKRDEEKLPWPVQVATEVTVKDDERISGRKIFGENIGYERYQSAQLQNTPESTPSTDATANDNN